MAVKEPAGAGDSCSVVAPVPEPEVTAAQLCRPDAGSGYESGAHACERLDFDALYDKYFAAVWRTLRALGVPATALDDAVQDVFLVVHRQLPQFEARSTTRTWVCGIACNVASNYRRRERRKGGLVPLDPKMAEVGPTPDDRLEQRRTWQAVSHFLDQLNEGKRAAYVLSRFEGLSALEIAEALAIPLNTVYSRIHAVEGAFKTFLQAHGAKELSDE
jgi:RNA polymerase sigma-70 factor (ECF subfamily)